MPYKKNFLVITVLLMLLTVSIATAEEAQTSVRYIFSDIAEKVSSAVVNVETVSVEEVSPFGGSRRNPFRDFFGEKFPSHQVPREGVGSGFIISTEGYILTNYHVIQRADEITVRLADGTHIESLEIVGTDAMTDIAVLKIPENELPEDLPAVQLGNSEEIRVGEWVVAIGNPYAMQLGDQHTVTAGIISARDRTIKVENRVYENFIQTDAPINPGNSGGPLINLGGEVIGINTAIIPYAQGIGFTIPINKALEITEDLMEYGQVKRPWLGVVVSDLTYEIADYLELPDTDGALIQYVAPESPAEAAGFKRGDVIREINKEEVAAADDVVSIVESFAIGDSLVAVIYREGYLEYLSAEIETRP